MADALEGGAPSFHSEPGPAGRGSIVMKRAIFLLLCLEACTPLHPQVSLEPGASLKGYHAFVVGPVTDQTGAPFDVNVTDSLRREIADRLRSHGLRVVPKTVADTIADALLVTSTLVGFRGMSIQMELPSPGGDVECRLRTELRDNQTGRPIGQIVASDLGGRRPLTVLAECAHDVADAIYQLQR